MAKYRFTNVLTVEDILKGIERTDIPSTEVSLLQEMDDTLELDFGNYDLKPKDEEKLKTLLNVAGFKKMEKKAMPIKEKVEGVQNG